MLVFSSLKKPKAEGQWVWRNQSCSAVPPFWLFGSGKGQGQLEGRKGHLSQLPEARFYSEVKLNIEPLGGVYVTYTIPPLGSAQVIKIEFLTFHFSFNQ